MIEGQQTEWTSWLRARFEIKIPDVAARLKFMPRLSGADYLHLIDLADIVLDTPYFCGGNTSFEAFALGKVVVTLPGDFMRGRVTLGLYRQMGITECIAESPTEYSDIAVKFAHDKAARQHMENRIREAHGSIFDTRSALQSHEKFFLEIMEIDNQ